MSGLGNFLKPEEVQSRLGISRGTLESLIETEGFPKPIRFSGDTISIHTVLLRVRLVLN